MLAHLRRRPVLVLSAKHECLDAQLLPAVHDQKEAYVSSDDQQVTVQALETRVP